LKKKLLSQGCKGLKTTTLNSNTSWQMAALVEPISMALNCRQVQNLLKEVIAHEAEVQSSTNPNHSKLACSASAVGMFSDLVVRSNKNDTDSDSDADSDSSDNDDENDESENGAGSDAGFAALAVSNNRVPSLLIPLPSTGTGTGTSAGAGATATQKTCLIIPSAILMQSTSTPTPTSLSAIASLALQASISLSKDTPSKSKSLVILLRSGAFASAVFTNCDAEPILHSTKKRYTVRKGQGGAQGSNDSNNGKAKSIGAQLRRDGEKKLWIDVRDTLVKWHAEVAGERAKRVSLGWYVAIVVVVVVAAVVVFIAVVVVHVAIAIAIAIAVIIVIVIVLVVALAAALAAAALAAALAVVTLSSPPPIPTLSTITPGVVGTTLTLTRFSVVVSIVGTTLTRFSVVVSIVGTTLTLTRFSVVVSIVVAIVVKKVRSSVRICYTWLPNIHY